MTAWSLFPGNVRRWWGTCRGGGAGCQGAGGEVPDEGREEGWAGRW